MKFLCYFGAFLLPFNALLRFYHGFSFSELFCLCDFQFKKNPVAEFKGKVGLKLELSIKASGKIDAIIFEADYKLEASGVAETYFEPRGTFGKDDGGIFLDYQIDWSGIRIVVIVKAKIGKSSSQLKRPFTVVDRCDKIAHGKPYILKK